MWDRVVTQGPRGTHSEPDFVWRGVGERSEQSHCARRRGHQLGLWRRGFCRAEQPCPLSPGCPPSFVHTRPGLCSDAHTHVTLVHPALASPETSWKPAERVLERLGSLRPSWRRGHRLSDSCLRRPWEQRWGLRAQGTGLRSCLGGLRTQGRSHLLRVLSVSAGDRV